MQEKQAKCDHDLENQCISMCTSGGHACETIGPSSGLAAVLNGRNRIRVHACQEDEGGAEIQAG